MVVLYGKCGKLKLRVHSTKRAVAPAWERAVLGYSFWVAPGRVVKRRVSPKALMARKAHLRHLTRRSGGRSLAQVVTSLRRRLRALILKQWKRGPTAYRALRLRQRGLSARSAPAAAAHVRRWWRLATQGALTTAFPVQYFDQLGVPRLYVRSPQHAEPPDVDPHVRWWGREVAAVSPLLPIPIHTARIKCEVDGHAGVVQTPRAFRRLRPQGRDAAVRCRSEAW